MYAWRREAWGERAFGSFRSFSSFSELKLGDATKGYAGEAAAPSTALNRTEATRRGMAEERTRRAKAPLSKSELM